MGLCGHITDGMCLRPCQKMPRNMEHWQRQTRPAQRQMVATRNGVIFPIFLMRNGPRPFAFLTFLDIPHAKAWSGGVDFSVKAGWSLGVGHQHANTNAKAGK